MRAAQIIQSLAAVALLAIPATALAAPDQNSGPNQNQCGYYNSNGQWVAAQCNGQNGQNGQWNNNGRNRHHDRDDQDDNDQGNNGNHYGWNKGRHNPHNNGQYNNRNGTLTGYVASFTPYNLYLSNGTHVELHNGTVINPRGANLSPGTRVRVIGNRNSDGSFNANEIDVTGGIRY